MRTIVLALLIVAAIFGAVYAATAHAADDTTNRFGIPACAEDEVVGAHATCLHPDTADFRNGRWHRK